jgi:CubicO group peptidase (beta-lactamase class C family)
MQFDNKPGAWLCALTLIFAHAASAAAQKAAGPQSDVRTEIIDILNAKDNSACTQFLSKRLASAARADSARIAGLLDRLRTEGSPYDLVNRDEHGRSAILKLRSARAGRTIVLQVAHAEQHADSLAALHVLASYGSVLDDLEWPSSALRTSAELADVVRNNLRRLEQSGTFSGVVYILKRDSVLIEYSGGMANREHDVRNALHTRFALASMSKMFTATAILQLVEQGRLDLNATVADVLPAYPNRERAQRITVRQLLEHTAGLGDQWSTPKRPVPGLSGQLAHAGAVAHAPLRFEPGSRWSYSNEGYIVLGAIIEHISGQSFHAYLQKHILDRAGMTETVLAGGRDDFVPARAVGYRAAADDPLGTQPPRANWSFLGTDGGSGAGGGYSTVRDLARFGRALRTGVLLGPELRDSMWTGRSPIPGHDGEQYGWGSFVKRIAGRTAVGHGGGGTGSGMDSGFRQFTDGSYTVVVLTNIDPPVGTNLTAALVKLIAHQPD